MIYLPLRHPRGAEKIANSEPYIANGVRRLKLMPGRRSPAVERSVP